MKLASEKDQGALLAQLGGQKAPAIEALANVASHAVAIRSSSTSPAKTPRRSSVGRSTRLRCGAGQQEADGRTVGELRTVQTLARHHGRAIKFEATVGAGLPIIDTFKKLDEAGDRVTSIDGCVSGTLMHVLSAVSAGRAFSDAVREAVERGYAEPDPRDDLSGRDAGRKGLILGRMIGYQGAPPAPEDLVPAKYAGCR